MLTREEMRFVLAVIDGGPDWVEVKDAPTENVREFLLDYWGRAEPVDTEGWSEEDLEGYEPTEAFRLGYERTRHAASWLELHAEVTGWGGDKLESVIVEHCKG